MAELDPELCLIREVQKHDCLYDKNSYNFKNNVKKEEIWKTIAKTVGLSSADEAKRLWKNLRERYCKERKQASKLPAGSKPLWPYFQPMKFMQKHILTRKRMTYHLMSQLNKSINDDEEKNATESITEQIVSDNSSKGMKFEEGSNEMLDLYSEEVVVSDAPYLSPEEPCVPPKLTVISPKMALTVGNQRKDVSYNCSKCPENREKPDKNMIFGQYVGLALSEMPTQEQNYKRLKIIEILNN